MLTEDLLNALKSYVTHMVDDVTLVVQQGEHPQRDELLQFLGDFASTSDRLHVRQADAPAILRSPISFYLEAGGAPSGMIFSGIPGGHEFNSLVLAVLRASGVPVKLDDSVQQIVRGIEQPLNFEIYVSLSCHNCPDVVQTLHQFAALNKNIRAEMIDGGLFPALIEKNNILGVPTVFLNGELFANGKVDTAQLLDKLIARYPQAAAGTGSALPRQDVTVIGGGPAGVAAAIYSARKGLKVTLVADRLGGQVKDTLDIENLISVPRTTGPALTQALQAHLQEYDITLREHFHVDNIATGSTKRITLSSGETIDTRSIIVATGAKWRELGIPGEKENIGNGVAYCPHCDGPFFKGKDVAVIGGGNSGIEAALDLAGIVRSVTVFEFMPELKADSVLVQQALKRDNITIMKNVACQRILAEGGKVTAIEYQERASGEVRQRELAGVFVQIGLVPNSAFVADILELNRFGEIVINEKGESSEPGIYACGDVTTVPYKQIVIAMGEGAKASLAAFEYLLTWSEQPDSANSITVAPPLAANN